MKIRTHSSEETQALGQQLGRLIKPPFVLFLQGDLGTGKTLLTQSIALGLGIQEHVNSPTFVLMKIYEGKPRLVHVDAYRLEGIEESIGISDELDSNTVMIIEWPQYLNEDISADMVIKLNYIDETAREITLESHHPIMEQWRSYVAISD